MLPFFNEQELLKPSDLIHDTKEYPFSIIITWQRQILEAVACNYKMKEISTFRCGVACPVYEFKAKRESIGIVLLPIGAPVVAGFLEEYIVRNVMRFVCIGYAGSLSEKTGDLLVIPSRAYRDEGISWHYAPHDSPWIEVPSWKKLDGILDEMGVPHICGNVWTTDAFYRETPSAVRMMKEQQCLCVDMECAAAMAVTKYRNVECLQMMFSADKLEKDIWEVGSLRSLGKDAYTKYAEIAIRVALS